MVKYEHHGPIGVDRNHYRIVATGAKHLDTNVWQFGVAVGRRADEEEEE